ncbi:hypothetical protein [Citrobacter sp. Cu233]|uniref:hypothetical protein n=1 Tax=Citrobacter sp. Cu233 TaxID=2985160 RepID=UPI002576A918|nr:hypothetical protein [Citrobacter sp. Cu233]MDM2932054.1 hypothetical protein [Citrobacter sp. Cu233]
MSDMTISTMPVCAGAVTQPDDPAMDLTDEQRELMQLSTQLFSNQLFSDWIMGDTDDPANPMYKTEW